MPLNIKKKHVPAKKAAKPKRTMVVYKKSASAPKKVVRKSRAKATQVLAGVNGAITASAFKLTGRLTRQHAALRMVGSPNIYNEQFSIILKSESAKQGYQYFEHMNIPQLKVIRDLTPAGAAGASGAGARYLLDTYMAECQYTNLATGPAEIELYDIVLKRDLLQNLPYTNNQGTFNIAPSPVSYWVNGTRINNNTGPLSTDYAQVPGASPFDSQLFRDYFKVIKRTRVMLPQGASHRHFVTLKPAKLVDDSMVQTYETMAAQRGFTVYTMAVARGFPCSDSGDEDPETVFLSPSQIGCIVTTRFKYTWVADQTNTNYTQQSLKTAVAPQIINIGSGQIETWTSTV